MVRVEFETLEQSIPWIKDYVIGKYYVGYITKKDELIFVPLKSTRPTVYGYVRKVDRNQVRKLLENQMKIYAINRFEWNAERDLVKEVVEEEPKDGVENIFPVYKPGPTAWKCPNVYIKTNVLNELRNSYFDGNWHTTKVAKDIIRKYYPDVCQKTIDTRLYNYTKYATLKLGLKESATRDSITHKWLFKYEQKN